MRYAAVLILLLASAATCTAYSDEYMATLWNYTTKEVISGLQVADLNGDGRLEVLVATSQEGAVYALDNKGGSFWDKPYGMAGYIFELSTLDIESDRRSEVIAGYGSHVVAIAGDGSELWKYSTTMNHVQSIIEGDVNGDGRKDVIASTYKKEECKNPVIFAIDASANPPNTLWKHTVKGYDIPLAIDAGDLNIDGKGEVVVGLIYRAKTTVGASCNPNIGLPSKLMGLDYTGQEVWEYPTLGGVTWVEIADINDDGKKEILISAKPYVYALTESGQPLWQRDINDAAEDGVVADIDGDGKKEIVVAARAVFVFDSLGNREWEGATGSRVYSVTTGDVDNNGVQDVIAGSDSVYVFDKNGTVRWKSPSYVSVDYVRAADMDLDGYAEVVAGAVKKVYYFKAQEYAKRLRASELYNQGLAYKSSNNIERAIECLTQSKEMFSQLGDMEGVSKCVNELDSLQNTGKYIEELKGDAAYYLNLSKNAYIGSNFVDAIRYAKIASGKYAAPQINDRLALDECDNIIENSKAKVAPDAEEAYDDAMGGYNQRDYAKALEHAKTAETLYNLIDDDEGSKKTAALIADINSATSGSGAGANETGRGLDFLSGVSRSYALLIAIAAVLLLTVIALSMVLVKYLRTPRLKLDEPAARQIQYRPAKEPLKEKRGVREYAPKQKAPGPRNKGIMKTSTRRAGHNLMERMNYHKKRRRRPLAK